MATIGQIKAARAAQKQAGVSGRINPGDFIKQADGTYVNRNTAGVSPYQGRPKTPQPTPVPAPNLPTTPTQANSTPTQPNVVNSSNLAPVVKTPLPDAAVSTYGGVDGAVDSVLAQAKKAQEDYLKAIKDQGTISESVDRTAQDKAKQEADKFTAQLEQEQLANRRRIEKLRTNTTGMLESGIAIEEDRLNRESLSKQADIAVQKLVADNDYANASAIADRQVAMKMEQSKANLEALKLLDSRAYGEVQAKKEREYRVLERNENTIAQLKLKVAQYAGSNASSILAKLSALDTTKLGAFDEAVAIAGKYSEDPLDRQIKQAQLAKLTEAASSTPESSDMDKNPDFKKLKGNADLKAALEDYQKIVKEQGARKETNPNASFIKEKYGAVVQAYRAAVDLGALQGSDVQLVDDAIKKATYEGAGISNVFFGIPNAVRKWKARKGAENSIDSAFTTIERNNARLNKNISASHPSWVDTPYYKAVISSNDTTTPTSEEDVASQYMQAATNVVWSSFED